MNIPDEAVAAFCNAERKIYGFRQRTLAELKEHTECFEHARTVIAAAAPFLIAKAIKSERERCAKIAGGVIDSMPASKSYCEWADVDNARDEIIRAIRGGE